MDHVMEIEVEVTITARVLFSPVKAEPDNWGYAGGTPGHPAHIEDLEAKSIITNRIMHPHVYDSNGRLKREERETPLNVTYNKHTLDNELNFLIMGAMTDQEWSERCLEHASKEKEL